MPGKLILFDGVCNLCNSAVQFVLRHDKKKQFRFASLQSETGRQVLAEHDISSEYFNSFVLVDDNNIYHHSTGALRVAKYLNGLWPLLYGFIIIPRFLRDGIYRFIAKNRYRWFGQSDSCLLPTAEYSERFLN